MIMLRSLIIAVIVFLTIKWCNSCPNLSFTTHCYWNKRNYVSRLFGTKTTYSFSQTVLDTDYHKNHELTKGYRPVVVYGVFRHAIRYPDADDIKQMQQYLPLFQQDILKNRGELCNADLEAFRNWRLNMKPEDDNNVSESGREETIVTALRLKRMLKNNLDPDKADIEFGVTSKIRTTQTAEAFITGLRISKFAKNVYDDDSSESEEDKYKKLLNNWNPKKKVLDFLDFHNQCKAIIKKNGMKLEKPKAVKDFHKSKLITQMANIIKKRLGITTRTKLDDYDFIDVIFSACKYGYAIERESPWCAAFGTTEMKIIEYIEDLEDYLEDAYGREINSKMTCPLINDFLNKIRNPRLNRRLKTYLYFTHAGALKRLWTKLGLFKDSSLMTNLPPEQGFCTRNLRKWKSSLNTPFGANVVFIVYEPKRSKKGYVGDYRVIAYVNGKVERIRNCPSKFCKLQDFLKQFDDQTRCDLTSICSPQSFTNIKRRIQSLRKY